MLWDEQEKHPREKAEWVFSSLGGVLGLDLGTFFVPYIILKNVTFHVTKVSDVSLEKRRRK